MSGIVLITGAASGIGRMIATTLSKQYDLVLLDRDHGRLETLKQTLVSETHTLETVTVDLSDLEALQASLTSLKLSALDALINVASVPPEHQMFETLSVDDMRTMFTVNTLAPMRLFQWAVPLLKQGTLKSVINIGSVHTKSSLENGALFRATKAALETWSEQMALEYGALGFRVNTIAPGGVASGMLGDLTSQFPYTTQEFQKASPLKTPVLASHVADLVAYLLSDSARSITAQTWVIDAGYSKR